MFENTSFFSCLIESGTSFYGLSRLFFHQLNTAQLVAEEHFSIFGQGPHLVVDNHFKGINALAYRR